MTVALHRQVLRINRSARLFSLLALAGPVLWYRQGAALAALAAVGVVWLLAALLESHPPLLRATLVVEGAGIGLICGLSMASAPAVLLSLALPPFVAAVSAGIRGSLFSLAAELIFVALGAFLLEQQVTAEQSFSIFTWCMAGLGLGLIGSFVNSTMARTPDDLAPYLDAQRLIRQLLDLSGDLSSGLDVTSLAGAVVSEIGDALPASTLALYLPRGEVLVPLISTTSGADRDLSEVEALALESWARSEPLAFDHAFAFPLGDSTVVGGSFSPTAELHLDEVERTILGLTSQLRPKAVQLDTALLFADFRDSASADVRNRLAREMHDGVAQDIAALGYVVDAIASKPASDKQAEQFAMLRGRITKVVAEVRQSVLTLRTSIGESESLGVAIGAVARHLSESSRVPIQVTLDEHATRLRPEVEAELFRIAQEAMNNAIKHAQCTLIEVNCQVHAPAALITVTDDGRGLQQARSDSHGLKIMRERARLIGADLAITDNPSGGLVVAVRIASRTHTLDPVQTLPAARQR